MSPMNASCSLRPLRPSQNRPACEQMSPSMVPSINQNIAPNLSVHVRCSPSAMWLAVLKVAVHLVRL